MSEYEYKPSSSLKFKNDKKLVAPNLFGLIWSLIVVVRKKKSSSSSKSKDVLLGSKSSSPSAATIDNSDTASLDKPNTSSSTDNRTESEKKFDQIQRLRMKDRVKNQAKLSHKDKVNQFNQHLDRLSEHHDLPKVGPG